MTSADSLVWRIESDPVLRSNIVVLGVLDRMPDWDGVVSTFARAQELLPRLRQRVVGGPFGHPRWEDSSVDTDFHIRLVEAGGQGDLRAVLDLAEPFGTEAFDPARPLWEVVVVDGVDGGRSAILVKLHHAVTDGVGGIALASLLFDAERDGPARTPIPHDTAASRGGPSTAERAARLAAWTAARARHPLDTAQAGVRMAGSVARMLAPVSRPMSPLMIGRSLGRSFHVLDLSFDDLDTAAKAIPATLNDVFLAGVGGGVAAYHAELGVPLPAMRVTVPISVRSSGDPIGGNHFTPARFVLPVGAADPVERARQAGDAVRAWRAEPAVGLTDSLAAALDRLPTPVVTAVFGGLLRNVDVDAANVPGVRRPVYLGGARIDRLWAFAPPTGAACSVTLLSHVDRCCIALSADTVAVSEPARLARCLEASFAELAALGRRDRKGKTRVTARSA